MTLDQIKTVALDEADEMLDMNFEEELDGILGYAPDVPAGPILVSATFPREVVQARGPASAGPRSRCRARRSAKANADIEHVVMRVRQADRFNAAINVSCSVYPEDKTLLFVRTRTETVRLAEELCAAGLAARALNGEMTQRERTATFSAVSERRGPVPRSHGRRRPWDWTCRTSVASFKSTSQTTPMCSLTGAVAQEELDAAARTSFSRLHEPNLGSKACSAEPGCRGDCSLRFPPPRTSSLPQMKRLGDSFLRDLAELRRAARSDARSQELTEAPACRPLSPAELVALSAEARSSAQPGHPTASVRDDAKPGRREHEPLIRPARSPRSAAATARATSSRTRSAGAHMPVLIPDDCWRWSADAATSRADVVGAIRIAPKSSTVEISSSVAQKFEQSRDTPRQSETHALSFDAGIQNASTQRPRNRTAHAS